MGENLSEQFLPSVDFGLLSNMTKDRPAALKQIDNAFQTTVFIYLSNHGIPPGLVVEAFSWSKHFFDFPDNIKQLIRHPESAEDHRGCTELGTGSASQVLWDPATVQELRISTPPELKEVLEMGNPYNNSGPSKNPYPNRLLPEDIFPGFRDFIERRWEHCSLLANQLFYAILTTPDRDLLVKQQSSGPRRHHMSFLHYISYPVGDDHDRRLGAHTGYGQLTLLFQDSVGGLEVHDDETDTFRPVYPIPGTVVVNVGNLLEKQTNGRWKSALHRVTAPKRNCTALKGNTVAERYSMAFFF